MQFVSVSVSLAGFAAKIMHNELVLVLTIEESDQTISGYADS